MVADIRTEKYIPSDALSHHIHGGTRSALTAHRGWRGIMTGTDPKRTGADSERSGHYCAGIIDHLPDATFVIDTDGIVIAWNRAIEEMTGVAAEQMLGKGDHEYAIPFYGYRRPILIDLVFESDENLERDYYHIIKKEGDTIIAESDLPRPLGNIVWMWGKASPLYDKEGRKVGAIESIRDITDRRQAEEALRRSEKRLSDIIDHLPDATLAIDRAGTVIAWNRAIEEMTGVVAEHMLGKGNYEYGIPFYGRRRPILIDWVFASDPELEKQYTVIQREGDL
ncbi:MAG TPA: PAS domain S-box protein, partial [Methanoregula sp.]|nr:PAS domain S-box protein [Methanoregula sp.]